MPHIDTLSPHILSLGQWLMQASVSATAIGGIVFVVQLSLGRALTPAWRYRLWGLVVLRLMLPVLPAGHFNLPSFPWMNTVHSAVAHLAAESHPPVIATAPAPGTKVSVVVGYVAPTPVAVNGASRSTDEPDRRGIIWPILLSAIWLFVVIVLMGRLLVVNICLARRIRRGEPVTDPETLGLLEACLGEAGVSRRIVLLVTDAVHVPAAAGVWRAKILLPPGLLTQLSREEQRVILLHELAHVRCQDVAINWVLAVVQILHWFNPLIRLAFFRLRMDREIARDAIVLQRVSPAEEAESADRYARLLLNLTQSLSSFPRSAASAVSLAGIVTLREMRWAGLFGVRSGLKRRLDALTCIRAFPPRRSFLGPLLLFILAGITLSCAAERTPPTSVPATSAATPGIQEVLPKAAAAGEKSTPTDLALNRKMAEVSFDQVGFDDAIDYLRDKAGANIFVDWNTLEAAGVDRRRPVNLRLRDVRFSRVLTTVLGAVTGGKKLDYRVEDGVITISTAEHIGKNVITRVYDIHDLLVNVPDYDPKEPAAPATRPAGEKTDTAAVRKELTAQIIRLIEDTVDSESWEDRGGTVGTIRDLQGQLIVTQTPENNATIASLLDQLREGRSIQATVEARFISCAEPLARTLLAGWEKTHTPTAQHSPGTPPDRPGTAFFLSDAQVNEFLRTTQGSTESVLLGAPRITLCNGQRAYVKVTEQRGYVRDYATMRTADGQTRYEPVSAIVESGLTMDVQATASADRKSVTMTLRPKLSVLTGMKQAAWRSRPAGSTLVVDEPQLKTSELQTTITIPDHGTLLLGGMEDPGIGKSPLAATRPATKPNYLFILVKPSLIARGEVQ